MTTLTSAVEKRLKSPNPESDISIIVRHSADVAERMPEILDDNTAIRELHQIPPNFVQAEIPETDLETVCGLDGVEKVELEGSGEVLSPGNR